MSPSGSASTYNHVRVPPTKTDTKEPEKDELHREGGKKGHVKSSQEATVWRRTQAEAAQEGGGEMQDGFKSWLGKVCREPAGTQQWAR